MTALIQQTGAILTQAQELLKLLGVKETGTGSDPKAPNKHIALVAYTVKENSLRTDCKLIGRLISAFAYTGSVIPVI